jgi:hypothetical protein
MGIQEGPKVRTSKNKKELSCTGFSVANAKLAQ